jgi:hypothetical protein
MPGCVSQLDRVATLCVVSVRVRVAFCLVPYLYQWVTCTICFLGFLELDGAANAVYVRDGVCLQSER